MSGTLKPRRIEPGPGQESAWDYPRPPRLEPSDRVIRVEFGGEVVAESKRTWRVLETSHPPVYYIPLDDVREKFLEPSSRSSFCEWKGQASYLSLIVNGNISKDAAWFYPNPTKAFTPIRNYLAFFPSKVDACFVDSELVQAQAGDFYGGWVTSHVVGPFKGSAGTMGW